MDNLFLYLIIVPLAGGTISLLLPKKNSLLQSVFALLVSAATLLIALKLYSNHTFEWSINNKIILKADPLSSMLILVSVIFSLLILIYSMKYVNIIKKIKTYFASILWTLGGACGVFLSNHLLVFLMFWGFLGITLYLLIQTGCETSNTAAKKALIIIGGSDALILLGIGLMYSNTQTFLMDQIRILLNSGISYWSFILLAIGVIAKIGAVPLHTWIPDVSYKAPLSVSAFLPGSLDKLLGVYLLIRLSSTMFEISNSMSILLLIVGSLTILISVSMGLFQKDAKKAVGYLTIAGAGYFVLGFGTAHSIGIAGGLFYTLSSALWTQCLFLVIGNVEYRVQTTQYDKIGGLVKFMPFSFLALLIASLSVSGIPPFNGFAAKWMIYQGIIEMGNYGDRLWIIWLLVAMFGSAMILAISMKLVHSTFLGVTPKEIISKKVKEVSGWMTIPAILLAACCILFGVFTYAIPLKQFVLPFIGQVSYIGIWTPNLTTLLILLGLFIGLIIYISGKIGQIREATPFIGGEKLQNEERLTGTGFYHTLLDLPIFKKLYRWAELKWFDIYEQGSHLFFGMAKILQKAHVGVLNIYSLWLIVGMTILLVLLMK